MQNIHPLFVHFPLALLPVGLLFDILGYFLKRRSLQIAGWLTFGLGVVSAVITVITGMQAEETVSVGGPAHELLENHEHFQMYTTVFLVGLLIWRSLTRGGTTPRLMGVYLVVTAIAISSITFGAHYGGRLVYEYGVGTAVQPASTKQQPGESDEEQSADPTRFEPSHSDVLSST